MLQHAEASSLLHLHNCMQVYLNCGKGDRLVPRADGFTNADIREASEGTDVSSLYPLCWHSVEVVIDKQFTDLAHLDLLCAYRCQQRYAVVKQHHSRCLQHSMSCAYTFPGNLPAATNLRVHNTGCKSTQTDLNQIAVLHTHLAMCWLEGHAIKCQAM